jgi:hypothetical protein
VIDLRIAREAPLFKSMELAELRAHELAKELAEAAE